MPDDLRAAAEQARQLSESFLNRSREQMSAAFATQREMGVGVPAAIGGAAMGAGAGAMMAGTPAGRLLEAINQIVRRGIGMGGGAVGAVTAPVFGAGAALGETVGGAVGFMAGNAPFGTGGIGAGAMMGAQRNMGLGQLAFTAYGAGLPFGLGRYAAQRTDMTQIQAQTMAREEMAYRLYGGGLKGIQGAWSAASLGISNFMLRREGLELTTFRQEDAARSLQANMRFVTREALQRGGMGWMAGAFPTGISRRGALALGGGQDDWGMNQQLGQLQAETGMSADQLLALRGRAMGTMGPMGINRLVAQGREALNVGVGRETRSVLEVQRILGLSEDEADQFFRTIGQMHGTAARIADMARTARRAAGTMGMDTRDVMGIMTQFETTGRQMMIGQAATGATGLRMAQGFRGWQMQGVMRPEESMMYGGRTAEEGLQILTQRSFQMGVGMFEQGRLGGLGLMMRYNAPGYQRFMGGGMGALEAQGVAGGMAMRDPLIQLRQRYDPRSRVMAGEEAMRIAYQNVQAMSKGGQFMFVGRPEEMMQAFEQQTGMAPLEARKWYDLMTRERNMIMGQLRGNDVTDPAAASNILTLHQRMRTDGTLRFAAESMGVSEFEAVGAVYNVTRNDKDLSNVSTTELVRRAFMVRRGGVGVQEATELAGGIVGARRAVGQGLNQNIVEAAVATQMPHIPGGIGGRIAGAFTSAMQFGAAALGGANILVAAAANARATAVTPEHLRAISDVFTRAGLSSAEITGRLFGTEAGGNRLTRQIGGQTLALNAGITNIGENVFGVEVGGETQRMSLQEIAAQFPEFAGDILARFTAGTADLGTSEGVQRLVDQGLRSGATAADFKRKRNESVMAKFRGVASYLLGPEMGGVQTFESFVTQLRSAAAGGGRQLEVLRESMPELMQFTEAMGRGGVDVGNLRKFFGDDFTRIMTEVTGKSAKELATLGDKGISKLLGKDMELDLFHFMMSKQSMESAPLGTELKPQIVEFGKAGLEALAKAITDAVDKIK